MCDREREREAIASESENAEGKRETESATKSWRSKGILFWLGLGAVKYFLTNCCYFIFNLTELACTA